MGCFGSTISKRMVVLKTIHLGHSMSNETSVLPRPFLQGATPCPFLVTPCLFKKNEMTPCLFYPIFFFFFFFFFFFLVKKAYNVSGF